MNHHIILIVNFVCLRSSNCCGILWCRQPICVQYLSGQGRAGGNLVNFPIFAKIKILGMPITDILILLMFNWIESQKIPKGENYKIWAISKHFSGNLTFPAIWQLFWLSFVY